MEIWVADLEAARASLGWLFEQLGYAPADAWAEGCTYRGAGEYLVLVRRRRPVGFFLVDGPTDD